MRRCTPRCLADPDYSLTTPRMHREIQGGKHSGGGEYHSLMVETLKRLQTNGFPNATSNGVFRKEVELLQSVEGFMSRDHERS